MAEFSDETGAELGDGLRISARGLRGEAERGVQGGGRGSGPIDPLEAALAEADGVRLGPAATVSDLQIDGSGLRGGGADGEDGILTVELPRAERGERQAVVVEENGEYAWFLPAPRARFVDIPLEAAAGTRDGVGSLIRKAIRVVAVKTVGRVIGGVAETAVGAVDRRRNPHQVRRWAPDDYREKDVPDLDPSTLPGDGPVLLMVHGFMGGASSTFHAFDPHLVSEIHNAYRGRTMAFGHPTLALSPRANAEWFAAQLPSDADFEIDILAHSRGGLVAREIADVLAASDTQVSVRRIVFVATPNDGTPLADTSRPQGLLDGFTNLLSAVPGTDTFATAIGLVGDILFENVLSELDGLDAMRPGGDYIRALNARSLPSDLALRSISAEFEPRTDAGIVATNLNRLIDAYFGGLRNDRVVPTIATHVTDGDFTIPAGRRLVLDSSRSVHHSSFWDNDRAAAQLEKWLRPDWDDTPIDDDETDPRAEISVPPDPASLAAIGAAIGGLGKQALTEIEHIVGGPIATDATDRRDRDEAVVVLPGIMGTYLRSATLGSTIWIEPRMLNRGHFERLALGTGSEFDTIETAGVHRTYLPLVTRLAAKRDVYIAEIDWRLDMRESAARLADMIEHEVLADRPNRTVHFVAHSMGGLVARSFAADHRELWKRAVGDDGRLVMLGTPNRGAYSMALTLTGDEGLLKVLALADFANKRRDIVETVASFPGVYQLLPAPGAGPDGDHHEHLYEAATWGPDSPVRQDLLDGARRFHESIAEPVDPDRMIYVGGYGRDTPYRLEVTAPGEFSMGVFKQGDGRVPLVMGRLDGATHYYSPAGHGGLIGDAAVLGALDGLLADGSTELLLTEVPARRGADDTVENRMRPIGDVDADPSGIGAARGSDPRRTADFEREVERAAGAYLGGGYATRSRRPHLTVSVVHASLEKTKHAVAVGHYKGVPPAGAEGFLDWKLAGALRRRQLAGTYPEQAGTASYIHAPHHRRPIGAVVLGLGEFGSLTHRSLVEAMTNGAIAAALHQYEATDGTEPVTIGLASVLVGSPGRYGVTLEESVFALTEGVCRANLELARMKADVAIDHFELIELYELRADDAARSAQQLPFELPPEITSEHDITVNERVITRQGARSGGSASADSGAPWVRMLVEMHDDEGPDAVVRTIELSKLERGAQANRMRHDLNLPKIREFVSETVRGTDVASDVSHTLFELIFPHRIKIDLQRSENLHLVLDPDLAQIPWELVADRDRRGQARPLAMRAGMLRQLRSLRQTRAHVIPPTSLNALVIGDPPTSLPRLPGARREAGLVARQLEQSGYDVTQRVYDDERTEPAWVEIENALFAAPYRIVHIAAHGIYDDAPGGHRSGVVVGPDDNHRLTALDFQAMSTTPDIVFLNACHLGRLGRLFDRARQDGDAGEVERLASRHAQPSVLAASVARQLMSNGVKAVVVAGWAVADHAAERFASTLYEQLLGGRSFGDAVQSARIAARAADRGRSNTWGAYQCYGDPDFRLPTAGGGLTDWPPLVSVGHLRREVEHLGLSAADVATERNCRDLHERLIGLVARAGDLAVDGRVQEALGVSFAELGDFERAVASFRASLAHPKSSTSLRSVERLANFEARRAMELCRAGGKTVRSREVAALFESSKRRLDQLIEAFEPSGERHALLGGLYKKRAAAIAASGDGASDELRADVAMAEQEYRAAWRVAGEQGSAQESYYLLNAIQMAAIRRGWLEGTEKRSSTRFLNESLAIADERFGGAVVDTDADYWDIARAADLELTRAFAGRGTAAERTDRLQRALTLYERAFLIGRSTVPQRRSVVDHLVDLAAIVDDPWSDELAEIADRLAAWDPD